MSLLPNVLFTITTALDIRKFTEMAKFLDKDQRTAVHYIFNKIPKKKYYEICCKYLKENLSESNRKTEIEKGLRAWLAFLLWHGYSSEYIYI